VVPVVEKQGFNTHLISPQTYLAGGVSWATFTT